MGETDRLAFDRCSSSNFMAKLAAKPLLMTGNLSTPNEQFL
jgi:hypothetical protein